MTTPENPLIPAESSDWTNGFMDPQKIVASFGIKEGMRIADFGSGAGYFTVLMAKLVGEAGLVTAVDVMDTALDIVRAKTKAQGLANVEVVRSNLEVLGSSGLVNESQDLVLLKNMLFQSSKKEEIIREANRVLKASGSLVVIDWKKGTPEVGPPDELRTDAQVIRQMASGLGFEFVNSIDPDAFHFGMILKKT